jgi:hypothetical protein
VSGLAQPLLARLRRLARAAADGATVDPDRDARSIDADGRAPIEKLEIVARIAGGRSPAAPDSTTAEARRERSATAAEAERIGPCRIVGRLGEGGMRVVYEAEQTEPVRRHGALKLVKQGMDTKEVVAGEPLAAYCDRTRRYPFVSELIADVERHLRHEPVLAGTAGRAYRRSRHEEEGAPGTGIGSVTAARGRPGEER